MSSSDRFLVSLLDGVDIGRSRRLSDDFDGSLSERLKQYLSGGDDASEPSSAEVWIDSSPISHHLPSTETSPDKRGRLDWWAGGDLACAADDTTFVGETDGFSDAAGDEFYLDELPKRLPPRRRLLTNPLLPRTDSSNSSLPARQYSTLDLRRLACSIFLLSKVFCPSCTPSPAWNLPPPSAPQEEQLLHLNWSSLPAVDQAPLSYSTPQALTNVLHFIKDLQIQEHSRRRHDANKQTPCAPPSQDLPFSASFWSLTAALTFQNKVQSKVHTHLPPTDRHSVGPCCSTPGLSLLKQNKNLTADSPSSYASHTKKPSFIAKILELNQTLANTIRTLPSDLHTMRCPFEIQLHSPSAACHLNTHPVVLRDCFAVLHIIQRFCTALFIGSAWVDELGPLSTSVLGRFLGQAFNVLTAAKECQRTASMKTIDANRSRFRRMAAATATSLYANLAPCVHQSTVETSVLTQTQCSICQYRMNDKSALPREHQQRLAALQRSLGTTPVDFEAKLFAVMRFVDHRMSLSGEELRATGSKILDMLSSTVLTKKAPSMTSGLSVTTTAGGGPAATTVQSELSPSFSACLKPLDFSSGYSVPLSTVTMGSPSVATKWRRRRTNSFTCTTSVPNGYG